MLDDLSHTKQGILKVVEHLIETDHVAIVIGGIFHQLYTEGEKNSSKFYNQLLNYCTKLVEEMNENDENKQDITRKEAICGEFSVVPDSLLCKMGSYLKPREIFRAFQRINRRFFQMGIKPETIIEWGFMSDSYHYTFNTAYKSHCKFEIFPILNQSKLKRFNLRRCNRYWANRVDFASMPSMQHIESSMFWKIYIDSCLHNILLIFLFYCLFLNISDHC